MLKLTSVLVIVISSFFNSGTDSQVSDSSNLDDVMTEVLTSEFVNSDSDVCRATCTIGVMVMGTLVTHTASAGGFLVSCETAGARACAAAQAKADADPMM